MAYRWWSSRRRLRSEWFSNCSSRYVCSEISEQDDSELRIEDVGLVGVEDIDSDDDRGETVMLTDVKFALLAQMCVKYTWMLLE